MNVEIPRCPNCGNSIELRSLFSAVGTNPFGVLRQPASVVCPRCSSKLRVRQPYIVVVNLAAFICFGACVAMIDIAERRAGISTKGGISGLVSAGLFVIGYESVRRWYTPRLAHFYSVPVDHALYLPLEPRENASSVEISRGASAFYDMSKEFWYAVGLVLLICALAVPIIGWSFTDDHSFLGGISMLSIIGAGFMLQLGNASDSRKDRKN